MSSIVHKGNWDSVGALVLAQIIAFMIAPAWKAMLLIPVMLALTLPFVLLARWERARRAGGQSTSVCVAAMYVVAAALLVMMWLLFHHMHLAPLLEVQGQ